MDRRDLLRAGALGAGGAWVAPAILTLDAAAAAGSCTHADGAWRAYYLPGTGFSTPANGGGCNPVSWNGVPAATVSAIDVAITGTIPGSRTFTFTLCNNCTFSQVRGHCGTTGNTCIDGTLSGNVATLNEAACGAGFPTGVNYIKLLFSCV